VTDELEPARSEQTASELGASAVILGRVHLATGALLTSGVVMRARAGQRLGNHCAVLENGVLVGQAAHSRPRVGWVTRGEQKARLWRCPPVVDRDVGVLSRQ
jgi:carbonic anhydrase/acetyltransferase-like protein (isoleucine patch superfamily)